MKKKKTHDRSTPDKYTVKRLTATAALAAAAVLSIVFRAEIKALFAFSGIESIYAQAEHYPLSIYFPDAGSAGCALIHSSESGDILIDCGREKAQHDILSVLSYLDIDTIDTAILTHPDSDHIGNFSEVVSHVPVDRFITCEYSRTCKTQLYISLSDMLDEHDIPITYAKKGDTFLVGDISLDILSPDKIYKKSNDNSLVIRLTYNGFTALFTGDITKKAEKDILESGEDLSADVLCVSHHGSGSSSTEEFLNAVSPDISVISVQESEYTPNGGTIKRLADTGSEIYRTDISGTIAVFLDENGEINIRTEK